MNVSFVASQSVELVIPEQPIPIQHYLRQPRRLIQALTDPSRIETLNDETFRLKMRPLHFMMFTLQPTVDIRIWTAADGSLRLESVGCEIRGVEFINQRFHLGLVGYLTPFQVNNTDYLTGKADLNVQVDLPPALWFTPRSILETTGNGLLHSVLLTIKQRLMHQLLTDYRQWVAAQLQDDGAYRSITVGQTMSQKMGQKMGQTMGQTMGQQLSAEG